MMFSTILVSLMICTTEAASPHDVSFDDLDTEAAMFGVSLIQSGKSFGAGKYTQEIENDPFGDLTDDFDGSAKTFVPTAESDLSMKNTVSFSMDDMKYMCQFVLDLATFAVVTSIFHRLYFSRQVMKKEKKGKSAPMQTLSSRTNLKPTPVDFGALMKAAKSVDPKDWRACIKEIPNYVHAEDSCGCTALHVAAHSGSVAMAQELITLGADVNAKDAWEETPLHVAAREDSVGVCKLLLQHGAELNALDGSDHTPLLSAGHAGKESTCAFLLESGGDCGGVADSDIPAQLSALILRRMIAPSA